MRFIDFTPQLAEQAHKIAIDNYAEECAAVPALPKEIAVPEPLYFAQNGLGIAAMEGESPVGFLGCFEPWENAFDSAARGTFSPIHAHGAVKENRGRIYRGLYQAAAEKWAAAGISYHAIGLYAHDKDAVNALFTYGFGQRCADAVRLTAPIEGVCAEAAVYREIGKDEVSLIRDLRRALSVHLGKSPCFMVSSEEDFNCWLNRAECRNSRVFAAFIDNSAAAFLEVRGEGENFAAEAEDMLNICGAYCIPELRGKGIFQGLLNFAMAELRQDGVVRLGVDYESFNPTALGFWTKYFTPYTCSVTRRLDDCAIKI